MNVDDVPINGLMLPVIDFESPKYRTRYLPPAHKINMRISEARIAETLTRRSALNHPGNINTFNMNDTHMDYSQMKRTT